jgi:hypothetical protein
MSKHKTFNERIFKARASGNMVAVDEIEAERDAAYLLDDGKLTAEFVRAMRAKNYKAAATALWVRQEASAKKLEALNRAAGREDL